MGASLPVACTLTDAAVITRREEDIRALMARGESHEIEDGWEIAFPGDVPLADIARIVAAERECCAFLRFELACEPEMGPVTLRMRGPEGTRESLRDWFSS